MSGFEIRWRDLLAKMLLLLPLPRTMFCHGERPCEKLFEDVHKKLGEEVRRIHVCLYSAPFSMVSIEVEDVYPVSQCEVAHPPDLETSGYVVGQVREYLNKANCETLMAVSTTDTWEEKVAEVCVQTSSRKVVSFK